MPEDYARLQVARLNKALRCADVLLEEGEAKAIPHFVKVVAELDRYHGLTRPMRLGKPARQLRASRLPPPPLALTHTGDTPQQNAESRACLDGAPRSRVFVEALRTLRVRSCLRPVDAGWMIPLALMLVRMAFRPIKGTRSNGAARLSGFQAESVGSHHLAVALDANRLAAKTSSF